MSENNTPITMRSLNDEAITISGTVSGFSQGMTKTSERQPVSQPYQSFLFMAEGFKKPRRITAFGAEEIADAGVNGDGEVTLRIAQRRHLSGTLSPMWGPTASTSETAPKAAPKRNRRKKAA